jgi:hypothetical protein
MPLGPLFLIQIVHAGGDGAVAKIPGGGQLEADLTELFVSHILSKGVGFLRTQGHVEKDIRDGIKDAIMSLKQQTTHIV